jgi:hypothetical protein
MTIDRHRDKNGELSRKYGSTLIHILRKHYGATFAQGCGDDEKLSDVLHKLDEPSLSKLVLDHGVKSSRTSAGRLKPARGRQVRLRLV